MEQEFAIPELTVNPPKADEIFGAAFYFAVKAHEYQFRKTGSPYIDHPVRVAGTLLHIGAKPELVTAGFLHDVLENTNRTAADITALFGQQITDIVIAVTENKNAAWKERKQGTINSVLNANSDILLLLFADKADNAKSIKSDKDQNGEEMWSRFSQPKDMQVWYYRELQKAFNKKLPPLYEEFNGLTHSLTLKSLHTQFNEIIDYIF